MIESPLAEHFPAGEYLADELDERGWSHADFANIIDCPTRSSLMSSTAAR